MTKLDMIALVTGGGGELSNEKKRDLTIDLLKGCGIILMVFRHARGPLSDFVLLFHMSIFFIASGFLYRTESIRTMNQLKQFIIKKIKGLWFPYFGFSALFILCHNLFLKWNIYTDKAECLNSVYIEPGYAVFREHLSIIDMIKEIVKAFFFRGGTQIGGALWFLQTLFWVIILYAILDFIIKQIVYKYRLLMQGLLAIVFLTIGYICYCYGITIKNFDRVFSVYVFIYIGEVIKYYGVMDIVFDKNQKRKNMVIGVIMFGVLCLLYHRVNISISENRIGNPLLFIISSLIGWAVMFEIASVLKNTEFVGNNVIVYISQHAISIIALHFLAFKIVNAVGVILLDMPHYLIAVFPVLFQGKMWWIAYMIVGIGVPLIISFYWSKGKKLILKDDYVRGRINK